MHRITPYATLFVVVSLLQILFFNNLGVSVYLSPLIYIVFIFLLPLQMSHFVTLMLGLLMGVTMDIFMGTGGINTIATLAVAFLRPYLLGVITKVDVVAGGGVPSDVLLGQRVFITYLVSIVAIHHSIFFAFESLSVENWGLYTLRFLVSGVVSTIFILLIARVFTSITFSKRG